MSKIDDGGTAFPLTGEVLAYQKGEPQFGMTLRDYFAAQAMQGFISSKAWHPDFIFPADFAFDGQKRAANAVASAAYKYANAMLLVRSVL